MYKPSDDELAALRSYAAEHGRKWKEALSLDWYNARPSYCADMPNRGSILHGLRNHPGFGPSGLAAFRLNLGRVQIPAYTDRWMMGDRFGDLVRITRMKRRAAGNRAALLTDTKRDPVEIGHVKLDKSGKVVRVILADCEVI